MPGYIYGAEMADPGVPVEIPDAVAANVPVPVTSCEFVPDAYEAILAAEQEGLLSIRRYEEMGGAQREWIERTMRTEYENAADRQDYRHFLKGKFPFLR